MAKNVTDIAEVASSDITQWQPRSVTGTFEQLAATATSVSDYELWSKIECDELIGQEFLIVDVKMTASELGNGDDAYYAQVFLVTRDNAQRYFSTNSLPIKQTVQAILEQGMTGVIRVPKGLAKKTVPAKVGGLPDGKDRPAFDSFRFAV